MNHSYDIFSAAILVKLRVRNVEPLIKCELHYIAAIGIDIAIAFSFSFFSSWKSNYLRLNILLKNCI